MRASFDCTAYGTSKAGLFLAALPLLLFALVARPHHSVAAVDFDVELYVEGTVTRFDYIHPHSWLHVAVENADGSSTAWRFELDSPVRLGYLGVTADYWQPGDPVSVKAYALKGEDLAGYLAGTVMPDGRSFGDVEGIEDAE